MEHYYSAHFLMIQGNQDSGWDLMQVLFPKDEGRSDSMTVESKALLHYSDQKTAELAAKNLSTNSKIQFMPEGSAIITITPRANDWFPVEITTEGAVTSKGDPTNLRSAITKAQQVALRNGLLYLGPRI